MLDLTLSVEQIMLIVRIWYMYIVLKDCRHHYLGILVNLLSPVDNHFADFEIASVRFTASFLNVLIAKCLCPTCNSSLCSGNSRRRSRSFSPSRRYDRDRYSRERRGRSRSPYGRRTDDYHDSHGRRRERSLSAGRNGYPKAY